MHRNALFLVIMFVAPFVLEAQTKTSDSFGAKEFQSFHKILHPLQHTALPRNDFKTIRERADTLSSLGFAIVRLGAPTGNTKDSTYIRVLQHFDLVLKSFNEGALGASDSELRQLYLAVHDTYEELAGAIPE